MYIDNVHCKSCFKKFGLIKKLKFTLCRNILSKMYVTFVGPILDYASVVWDRCTSSNIDKLEKVQLCAGLPILAKKI